MDQDYTSIKVPKVLADRIMNNPTIRNYGYRSVSEFVIESIRLYLIQKYGITNTIDGNPQRSLIKGC